MIFGWYFDWLYYISHIWFIQYLVNIFRNWVSIFIQKSIFTIAIPLFVFPEAFFFLADFAKVFFNFYQVLKPLVLEAPPEKPRFLLPSSPLWPIWSGLFVKFIYYYYLCFVAINSISCWGSHVIYSVFYFFLGAWSSSSSYSTFCCLSLSSYF